MKLGAKKPRLTEADKVIGLNLRALRVARGLTQRDVAGPLGCTFQQLQKYERGANRLAAATAARLANFFHVPITEIFVGVNLPAPSLGTEHGREALEMIRAYNAMGEKSRRAFRVFALSLVEC